MFKGLFLASMFAVAVGAVAVALPTENVSAASVVVYDSIDHPLAIAPDTITYAAADASEIGDLVHLAGGSRTLQSVTVVLASAGCEKGSVSGDDCVTTSGATFAHPLTLNIYNPDSTKTSGVGTLVTSKTQTFAIPYRPSPVASCGAALTKWKAPDGTCSDADWIGTTVTFDFPSLPTVPDKLIWTVAFNSTKVGATPIAKPCQSNCAYDLLDLGASQATDPTVGVDPDPDGIVQNSNRDVPYCLKRPAAGRGVLQIDTTPECWQGSRPMAAIKTFASDPVPTTAPPTTTIPATVPPTSPTTAPPTTPTTVPPSSVAGSTPTAPTTAPSVTASPNTSAADFNPVSPSRVFDTRTGTPQYLRGVAKAKVAPGRPLEVQLTDLPGGLVPASGVGAVSISVTSTQSQGAGFVTVSPCGSTNTVSSLNFQAASDRANAVVTPVSATGTVCFTSSVATDLLVDLNGWFKSSAAFNPVSPTRVFDTRAGSPPYVRHVAKAKVGPGAPLEVQLTDLPGLVPGSGVGVVSMNVTSTQSQSDGFVTVSPCTTADAVSSVNFQGGDDVANLVLARVSAGGTVCFNASTPTDLIVDINGWFAAPSGFTSVNPARVADTRAGTAALRDVPKTRLVPGATLTVKLTDLPGLVPATGVGAVALNVTSTRSTGDGYLTVSPCGSTNVVSNVNFQSGLDRANAVLTPVSTAGTICVTASQPTDVIIDVSGWFSNATS